MIILNKNTLEDSLSQDIIEYHQLNSTIQKHQNYNML